MSEHRSIKARTDSSASSVDQDLREVTGEAVGSAKFALHTISALDPYLDLVRLALWGNLPEPNYDTITRTVVDADTITYRFLCGGINQFLITISAATTNPVATITNSTNVITEDFSFEITESGDNVIQE